jgi:ssDNA thymidine ADP-ribosyltransferase, DarT
VALSQAYVEAHIAEWQQRLTSAYYPHRKHWPSRLFHHAPLENAVAILKDGYLRSRNDAQNTRPRDVAAAGVIDARAHAHDRVRLYFRPKTPTQWHIEGIRKAGECAYGEGSHAPVLVMFALDASYVLTRPDVMFSNQNMQLGGTEPGNSQDYFSAIPFDKVFSEGGTGGDRSITDARAAEVLPTSPLPLNPCLRELYFRSEPERDTVLHLLQEHRSTWSSLCHVSDALKVFEKKYAFVQEIGLTPEGVIFHFNPRFDGQSLEVAIEVFTEQGVKIIDYYNDSLAARPPQHRNWIFNQALAPGTYLVRLKLEGQLAYEAWIPLASVLF